MKPPKDRKMYPGLLAQYIRQDKRIKDCGWNAYFIYLQQEADNKGTMFKI